MTALEEAEGKVSACWPPQSACRYQFLSGSVLVVLSIQE